MKGKLDPIKQFPDKGVKTISKNEKPREAPKGVTIRGKRRDG